MSGIPRSTTDDAPGEHAVCGILDDLAGVAEENGRVRVRTLVEAFGHRGYGALLLVPALLEISPLGAVPGVPTALALVVLLFAVQIALGRDHMWLPDAVGRRSIDGDKLRAATAKVRPVAAKLDSWSHGRLDRLVERPFTQVAAGMCAALTLTVPPLEVVPFASTVPMAAIAVFGLALVVRDGVLMLIAIALSLAALGAGAVLLIGG